MYVVETSKVYKFILPNDHYSLVLQSLRFIIIEGLRLVHTLKFNSNQDDIHGIQQLSINLENEMNLAIRWQLKIAKPNNAIWCVGQNNWRVEIFIFRRSQPNHKESKGKMSTFYPIRLKYFCVDKGFSTFSCNY